MIEKLTKSLLIKYGFGEETINRIYTWENYDDANNFDGDNCYVASQKEKKIYSGVDAYRKYYFRDTEKPYFPFYNLNLIDEYYNFKLTAYLNKQKALSGKAFIEKAVRKRFKEMEVLEIKTLVENLKEKQKRLNRPSHSKENIDKYTAYLDWLNELNENKLFPFLKSVELQIKSPESFEELFLSASESEMYLDILKNVDPPITSSNNRFRLGERQKGAIVAWAKALEKKGKIPHVKDVLLSKLLNSKIKGLNLSTDGRTLRNIGTTAYNKYYKTFLGLIT